MQGRYKAILTQKDSHLLEVCSYVVLNPVRAKMVEKPEGWKWSSYIATAGKATPHACLTIDWVLGQFSGGRSRAEREYRQYVHLGIGQNTIWSEVWGQILLGEDDFVDRMTEHIKKLVVVPSGMHRRKTSQKIYRNLIGVGFAADIIVVTKDDVERLNDNINLIIQPALEEGRVLYAA